MTEKIFAAVEKYRTLILDTERYIWANPETGYKEVKTSKYMEEKFRELGYDIVKADGITGFYARLDTGREGPELLILAELDSILCASHKDADPATGAVTDWIFVSKNMHKHRCKSKTPIVEIGVFLFPV